MPLLGKLSIVNEYDISKFSIVSGMAEFFSGRLPYTFLMVF